MNAVRALTEEVELGKIYTGTVRRLVDFGAFVEILPGKEGLVRTPNLSDHFVSRPEEEVQVGDEINVMVIEVDPQGRVNLSRKAALSGEMPSAEELEAERAQRGPESRRPRWARRTRRRARRLLRWLPRPRAWPLRPRRRSPPTGWRRPAQLRPRVIATGYSETRRALGHTSQRPPRFAPPAERRPCHHARSCAIMKRARRFRRERWRAE